MIKMFKILHLVFCAIKKEHILFIPMTDFENYALFFCFIFYCRSFCFVIAFLGTKTPYGTKYSIGQKLINSFLNSWELLWLLKYREDGFQ